jgi:hypothetical protein
MSSASRNLVSDIVAGDPKRLLLIKKDNEKGAAVAGGSK